MARAKYRTYVSEQFVKSSPKTESNSLFETRQANEKQFIDELRLALIKSLPKDKLSYLMTSVSKYVKRYNLDKDPDYRNTDTTELVESYKYINEADIDDYIEWCKLKNLSPRTIEHYKSSLNTVASVFPKALRDATELDIKGYLQYRLQDCVPETVNNERVCLNTFFLFLTNSGRISRNPMANIRRMKFLRNTRIPLTQMELELMRKACESNYERAILELLYSTGARVSEFVEIDLEDINFDKGTVYIKAPGKGGDTRYTVLSTSAALYIEMYLKEERDADNDVKWIFSAPSNNKRKINKGEVEKLIKSVGERANINRPITPHVIRHTTATHGINSNVPIDEIADLLGHRSVETTRIYAKRELTSVRKAYDKANL